MYWCSSICLPDVILWESVHFLENGCRGPIRALNLYGSPISSWLTPVRTVWNLQIVEFRLVVGLRQQDELGHDQVSSQSSKRISKVHIVVRITTCCMSAFSYLSDLPSASLLHIQPREITRSEAGWQTHEI